MSSTVETKYTAKGNHEKFLDGIIKKQDAFSKGLNSSDASMSKLATSIGSKVAPAFLLLASAKGVGASVREFAKFEKAMSNVQALTRPTAQQFANLSKEARELGRTTAFTAEQSAEAFAELGKLGFETNEILASSADILSLASAANADLATAASVTAKTLNQFALDATDAAMVTDLIAKASSSSAVDIYNFQEAMKIAGTTAAGFGTNVTETTAAISALADAGLEGTMAGTGLSRVMVELERNGSSANKIIKSLGVENGTLTEKLLALKGANMSTSDVIEAFGAIAGKSALTLINNAEAVDSLTKSYQDADGAAKEMADTQLDNLAGSVTLLKSAFSGLQSQLGETFSPEIRSAVDLTTKAISGITNALTKIEPRSAKEQLKTVKDQISGVNEEIERLTRLSNEPAAKLPKYLTGSSENAGDLNNKIFKLNQHLEVLKERQKGFNDTINEERRVQAQATGASLAKQQATRRQIEIDKEAEDVLTKLAEKERRLAEQREANAIFQTQQSGEAVQIRRKLTLDSMDIEEQAIFKIEELRDKSLANTKLTEEERKQIKINADNEIYDLQKANDDAEYEALKAQAERLLDAERDRTEKAKELRQKEFEDKTSKILDYSEIAQNVASTITTVRMASLDRETSAQIKAVKSSTKSEEEKAKAIDKIEKESAKERKKIAMLQWGIDLGAATASTAVAVARALAVPPAPNVLLAAVAGSAGAVQIASVAASKPRFAHGSVDASGQLRQIPRSFGSGGGLDSEVGLFSPNELIVPPSLAPQALAGINGTGSGGGNSLSVGGVNITVNGNATSDTVEEMRSMVIETFANMLEEQGNTNLVNNFLV